MNRPSRLHLIVIIATAREAGPDRMATALSAVPGIGGMLALRRVTTRYAQPA